MANVLLIVHLILAVFLIGVVLLQRSEGGALGIGGGGGGMVSHRGAATALGKATWGLAAAFIVTSLALTVIAAQDAGRRSVLDSAPAAETAPAAPGDQADPTAPPAADELDQDLQKLLPQPPAADPAAPPAAD
jgi:preprotein translocase subunit SecG